MKRKVLSCMLSMAIVFSTISMPVFAEENPVESQHVQMDNNAIRSSVDQFADAVKGLKGEMTNEADSGDGSLSAYDTVETKAVRRPSVNDYCERRLNYNGYVLKYLVETCGSTDTNGRKYYQQAGYIEDLLSTCTITVKSQQTLEFSFQLRYPNAWYPCLAVSFDYDLNTNRGSNLFGVVYATGSEYITASASFNSSSYYNNYIEFMSEYYGYDSEFDNALSEELSATLLAGMMQAKRIVNLAGCNMSDIGFSAYDNRVATGHFAANGVYDVCALCNVVMNPFVDVRSNDWYYDYVEEVLDGKYMTGLTANTFGPVDTLARAQFAIILHRMNGTPSVTYTDIFKDVPAGQWYTDAVIWANEKKVVTGYSNGNFGVSDNITREQMALMMFRYANAMGYDTKERASFAGYTDAASVSDYAEEAMQWAVGTGIITGKDGGTRLDPWGYASRAECATIIMRFVKAYNAS